MQCTIESYKALIEQLQTGDQTQGNTLKMEIEKLQREVQNMQARANKDKQKMAIREDEVRGLELRVRELCLKNDSLAQQLEQVHQ